MAAELAVEENVIEMQRISIAFNHRPGRRWLGRLAVTVVVMGTFLPLAASAALAQTVWTISSAHGPQHMPPGGTGQYIIQVANRGDVDSDGFTPVRVTDTLPPGVTVEALSDITGSGWDCSETTFPATTVTCVTNNVIVAPLASAELRGIGQLITITVNVDPTASGTADNQVTVEGGGASANASAIDPTVFNATQPGFGFVDGSFQAGFFDAQSPGGSPVVQAGAHPFEMRVDFNANLKLRADIDAGQLFTEPDDRIKTLVTRLPLGFLGNPEALPKCAPGLLNLNGPGGKGSCPANSQVGSADLLIQNGKRILTNSPADIPVHNVLPPPGAVAAFAFSFQSNPVFIVARLDPKDYSVITTVSGVNEFFAVRSVRLTLWGVPADPAHDPLRMNPDDPNLGDTAMNTPSTAPIRPFLTLPMQCGISGVIGMTMDSWHNPGHFVSAESAPMSVNGCDDPRFRFDPSITVQPESRRPNSPTGLDIDLAVPQKDDLVTDATRLYADSGDDRALPTPPLRDAKVTLPVGMRVSPSSANGLEGCTSLQIGLGNDDEPACLDESKIGTVTIETPVLPDPLTGAVYLASQTDNPFGSLLALYIVAKGPGVMIKLPGKIAPDPTTGQLTATFGDNPQLPFSHLLMHLKGGKRAALVTPVSCGLKTSTATFTSWNDQLPVVQSTDSFTISGDGNGGPCAPLRFDPGFVAGTKNPIAGANSPLVTRFTRSDADEELSKIDVSLAEGLLGRIAKVDLCTNAAADAGTCGDGSRIGTVTVGAGPGSDPFFITDGRAYITDGYKGAPFGLSMVVHAKAGPFDLGNVVVRAQIQIDKQTAALRIVSDPLPTILKGIPLQMRVVDVTVDRPGFTFNPTNCSELASSATLTSIGGKTSSKRSRFQVTDCAALPFKPRLTMRVGRKGRTASRTSTPLVTTLRMPRGRSANLAGVKVTLPSSLNALLPVITDACTLAEFHAGDCAKAKAGTATAVTPLLKKSLNGGVYFVKNGHPLPDLMVALRGQVDVDLQGLVKIPASNLLSTEFNTVPDVPITKFVLRLSDGKNGPIGVARNLCSKKSRSAKVGLMFTAQTGKVVRVRQHLAVKGCAKKTKKAKGG